VTWNCGQRSINTAKLKLLGCLVVFGVGGGGGVTWVYVPTNVKTKHIYIQSWPKISAPLVNMIKEGCENESALLILLIFYCKISPKSNLSFDNKKNVTLWNKCFSQIHVGHNYWHPKQFLRVKYLRSIFPFIFTILSTPGWLWTWNYPAMASWFTEI